MAKRLSEVERIRQFFAVKTEARALFLKILCADAGITISEPRVKKANSKGKKRPEFGNVDGQEAQPR